MSMRAWARVTATQARRASASSMGPGMGLPLASCSSVSGGGVKSGAIFTVFHWRPLARSFSEGERTKVSVQHANQYTNPSTATWCRWKAFEYLHDGRCCTMHRSLNVFGTNARIVASDEFGCSGRVSAGSENVLNLGGLGQRMQVGGACRRRRCPSCFARSRSVRALGCLEGRPRCVAQRRPSLTTPSELPRGTDSVSRPRVVRLIGLEYLEHHFRARRSERGDLTKVLLTQSNLALVPCHESILDHCDGQQGGRGLRAALVWSGLFDQSVRASFA